MRTLKALHETPGMVDALASAFATIETRAYVIADAYTHAPITPYAPIMGRVGIRADIQRNLPGLTALPVADVTPQRRREFADTLERLARIELQAWERACAMEDAWRTQGCASGVATARKRANRAAEESDSASDRAHAVRKFAH